MKLLHTATVLFALSTTSAMGQETTRQLGAHQHGVGSLSIAIEGGKVMMELEAPGMDIVGFGHAAATKADKVALAAAKDLLRMPFGNFVFSPKAGCTLVMAKLDVEIEGAPEGEAAGHDESAGDSETADHHDEAGGHSEFHTTYELTCANIAALETIEVKYFENFKRARELEVSIISSKGQKKYEVTRENPRILLAGLI